MLTIPEISVVEVFLLYYWLQVLLVFLFEYFVVVEQ